MTQDVIVPLSSPAEEQLARIRAAYERTPDRFQCLLLGGSGTGKSTSLLTAKRPILVHSFDPNGMTGFDKEQQEGWLMVERFETEDAREPKLYNEWGRRVRELERDRVFDSIGTFCIDSLTSLFNHYAAQVVKSNPTKTKRDPELPVLQIADYGLAGVIIPQMIKHLQSLPCDLIITGHVDKEIDPTTGRLSIGPALFKSLRVSVPLLFSELYYTDPRPTSQGMVYEFIVAPDGEYAAKSAIGKGKFKRREAADFTKLFQIAGRAI